jgi:hypothetical protein
MSVESLLSSTRSTEAINIFGTAFGVLLITVVVKYWTKAYIFRPELRATETAKRAAHFECLRVGVDLSLLGLGTYLSVTQIALEKNLPGAVSTLQKWNGAIIVGQIALLVLAGFTTSLTDSADNHFRRGIALPFVWGWISICTSAAVFYHIFSGG